MKSAKLRAEAETARLSSRVEQQTERAQRLDVELQQLHTTQHEAQVKTSSWTRHSTACPWLS